MNSVRKAMITTPSRVVATPFTTLSAGAALAVRPPPLLPAVALRTCSTTWYLVSRKPSGPCPRVRSATRPGVASMKLPTCFTSGGTNTNPSRAKKASARMYTAPTAEPRLMPRAWKNSTAGFSASARKREIAISVRPACAANRKTTAAATASTTPTATRIERGRKCTTRSVLGGASALSCSSGGGPRRGTPGEVLTKASSQPVPEPQAGPGTGRMTFG